MIPSNSSSQSEIDAAKFRRIKSDEYRQHRTTPISHLEGFKCWEQILERCYNPKHKSYPGYGARGVKVSEAWLRDPILFFRELGPRPSKLHTVDRINNRSGYVPGNIRWASPRQQSCNKSNRTKVTIRGETKAVAQWMEQFGLEDHKNSLYSRIKSGWDHVEALLVPFGSAGGQPRYSKESRRIFVEKFLIEEPQP